MGTVNGLEGFHTMRDAWPDVEKMACLDAEGKIPAMDEEMILMCTNNPDWVQWEFEFGKQAIELGADMILVDTPMSSSFIAGFLGGGFCPHCMEKFEKHLKARFTTGELQERFDLDLFDRKQVVERLSGFQADESTSALKEPPPLLRVAFSSGQGTVLVLNGDVTPAWSNDMGANFFKTYSSKWRDQILELGERLGLSSILDRKADGLVCAFPVLQPAGDRVVVHIVNYDVDYEQDRIREKHDLCVNLPRPDCLPGPVKGLACVPDKEDEPIPINCSEHMINFTLPCLNITASIVLSER